MDFEKLLKQATVKQKVAEKKHVLQKQYKEESKRRDLDFQKEEKRKAAAKLREMKEATYRKQLEYKGLISSSKVSDSSAATVTTSTSTSCPSIVSSGTSRTTSTNKDRNIRDKDKGREERTTTRTQASSNSSCSVSKPAKGACNSTKKDKHSHTASVSSMTDKLHTTSKSTPSSNNSRTSTTAKSATSSLAMKSKSSIGSSTAAPAKSKGKSPMVNNFEDLLNTAKRNATSEKNVTRFGKASGKDAAVLDSGRSKEPSRSSSPLGRSLLERNHSRLNNKRTHNMMMKGISLRGSPGPTALTPPLPGSSSFASKSSDLVRRPLKSPMTNLPSKQNGMQRKEPQLDRDSSKRHDHKTSRQDGSVSTNRGTSKGQVAFQQLLSRETITNKEDGLRGTKTPRLPPPSSLTPQQIQKLRAARAARAAAASSAPPAKKKAVNPNAFYGSAAARILQRKGEPKMSLPLKYTSSYVDEMLDYLQMEGMNSVDDLYSDEEEMDDFIASDDDDFIDNSEEPEDYSSAISKIFGYDRSRYADYDDDGLAMESSYAQQEFEEIRSARIGQQEDEEDIRREQQQFAKKKAKKNGNLSAVKSKQTKLSFR